MAFEVRTTADAEEDAAAILDWLMRHHAGETGLRWFLKMDDAISSLRELPHRCKLAPENHLFPFEVRELHYGNRPQIYRLLFTIEGNIVQVLRIYHGRRLPVSPN